MTPTKPGAPSCVQSPLLVLPRPLRHLFEEGVPEKSFSRSGILSQNICRKPSFRVSRRETDEGLERTSSQW